MRRVVILGAAGRDFHNFNVRFRHDSTVQVVAFTATQIPDIANRTYPAALAGELYPAGIPIVDEKQLETLIAAERVDEAIFSYSDISHLNLMHLASRVSAAGADFVLLGSRSTEIPSRRPVISVCAVRTGCGKSPVSRLVAAAIRSQGLRPVVIRHPMPYGDLAAQAVQRYAALEDLGRHHCTIEEREEYEPHLAAGTVVYAGVDYEAILRRAEQEADVILWDGGNNDTPFYRPDLEIVVVDPHRPGHEMTYYPGEVNFRRAQVIVINKVNTASPEATALVRQNIAVVNASATVIETACEVTLDDPALVRGRRVLVVEDGPTLTHGEMPYGAGVVAARQAWAAERVDPRHYAVGSIADTFARFPHLSDLLPAMGYSDVQCRELEETINRTPCDVVLVATPIDLGRLLKLNKPCVRARYEIAAHAGPDLAGLVADFCARKVRQPAAVAD